MSWQDAIFGKQAKIIYMEQGMVSDISEAFIKDQLVLAGSARLNFKREWLWLMSQDTIKLVSMEFGYRICWLLDNRKDSTISKYSHFAHTIGILSRYSCYPKTI